MTSQTIQAHVILVAYYAQTIPDIVTLIDDFARSSGIAVVGIRAIDNGGALPKGRFGTIEILPGDNAFWEFSGWSAGLSNLDTGQEDLLVLLNDSYRRNWTIRWPGRRILQAMCRAARHGRISGWLDNFSRTQRRINSRIVLLPVTLAPILQKSIDSAIQACRTRQAANEPLFDAQSQMRLEQWMIAQGDRWANGGSTRLPRIFVEHHLFDTIPARMLALYPRTWLGSQIYGIARKMAGERR